MINQLTIVEVKVPDAIGNKAAGGRVKHSWNRWPLCAGGSAWLRLRLGAAASRGCEGRPLGSGCEHKVAQIVGLPLQECTGKQLKETQRREAAGTHNQHRRERRSWQRGWAP